jgi:hypothetical protein
LLPADHQTCTVLYQATFSTHKEIKESAKPRESATADESRLSCLSKLYVLLLHCWLTAEKVAHNNTIVLELSVHRKLALSGFYSG